MKKYWTLILILAAFQGSAQAQASMKNPENQWVSLGIKGGASLSRMMYRNDAALSQLPQDTVIRPTAGVFVDIPLGDVLSVAPEVMYARRGTGLHYQHVSGAKVNYSLDVTYVDLRVPLEVRWPIRPYIQPYLLLGAEAGVRLGGKIHMDRTAPVSMNADILVGKSNMALLHAGAFAGVGIRSKLELGRRNLLLKLTASYHQGILDTYSPMEKNGNAQPQNINAYHIEGQRIPMNVEIAFGLAVSLNRRDDACNTFSSDRFRRKSHRGHLFGF